MLVLTCAQAQVTLPPVQPPGLPQVKLPVDIEKTVTEAAQAVEPETLLDARRLRVRALLREHRALIDTDPRGAPVVRAEVTALAPSSAALERARAAGFTITREHVLEGLGTRIVVLRAPPRLSTRQALKRLRALDAAGVYDFNHIYLDSGRVDHGAALPARADSPRQVPGRERTPPEQRADSGVQSALLASSTAAHSGVATASAAEHRPHPHAARTAGGAPDVGASPIKLGLIDGGVDLAHPAFAAVRAQVHGCGGARLPSAHGTAVASLLAGRADKFQGAAAGAEIYAADVYCGRPTGGAVDAVAEAFGWLARERVGVINVSLVGPANALLEHMVQVLQARGHLVVAAVGNDGPTARPLYPAAYPGVVGVTGVDSRRRVLIEALRGEQVDFAAPGADVAAAGGAGTFVPVRGTSFAAPVVAGLLARSLPGPDPDAVPGALEALAKGAVDLGARGRDPVYGHGFVAADARLASLGY